ncbi:ankyrin repeat domain-containing protein [Chryseobacterium sp. SL1]|uniref:ankyrin repeat domain-containing protein n=1 Tax=Chryseobacterium sp. SL1 TaxID=2995159 RepID=UPI002274ADA0|nr:ankyrin repeat domain-containing protein [Chryseobacterium sp. SL1]MCY1661154.1 ankyrin repeat domain-containing protein [Chryseobacterium sp. SL1]
MKKIILITSFLVSSLAFSQSITDKMKQAFETDNPTALVEELKSQKLNINDCFELKEKPYSLFAISIKMDKQKVFSELINQKADLNKICEDKSPLMYAVKYGKLIMVKQLVEAGADVNVRNSEGANAFYYAQKYQQKEIEEYLKSKIQK